MPLRQSLCPPPPRPPASLNPCLAVQRCGEWSPVSPLHLYRGLGTAMSPAQAAPAHHRCQPCPIPQILLLPPLNPTPSRFGLPVPRCRPRPPEFLGRARVSPSLAQALRGLCGAWPGSWDIGNWGTWEALDEGSILGRRRLLTWLGSQVSPCPLPPGGSECGRRHMPGQARLAWQLRGRHFYSPASSCPIGDQGSGRCPPPDLTLLRTLGPLFLCPSFSPANQGFIKDPGSLTGPKE